MDGFAQAARGAPALHAIAAGNDVSFDVDALTYGSPRAADLEVHPITEITSQPSTSASGPQVGVSERFLAYALKRGQIRVLDLALGVRGLLRGHTAAVTDLQFCGHRPEVLCSAAQDGFVLVRLLVVDKAARRVSAVGLLSLNTFELCQPLRVAWKPADDCFSAAFGSTLLLVDCRAMLASAHGDETAELQCDVQAPPPFISSAVAHKCNARALAFAPEGGLLAVATDAGSVHVWDTRTSTLTCTAPMSFTPAKQDEAATFVAWAHQQSDVDALTIICGVDDNRVLCIGRVSFSERRYTPTQRLCLASEDAAMSYCAFFEWASSSLLVACEQRPCLFSLHVDTDLAQFRGAVACNTSDPVLGLTMAPHNARGLRTVALFCKQPESLACYTLNDSVLCGRISTRGIAGPVPQSAAPVPDALELMRELRLQVDTLKAAFAEQHAQTEQEELERQERLVAVLCERISSELETRLRSDNQRALAVTEKASQHMSSALAMSMQEATKTSKAQFTQQAYAALSSEVDAGLARHLSTALKAPLADAVRSSMHASLLPQFELLCADMFSQANSTFQSGIEQVCSELRNASAADSSSALAARLGQIVDQAAAVTARLNDDVKRGVQSLLKPAADAREEPGQHADVQLSDAKNELTRLLQVGSFDAAFSLVLSNSNVDLLAWVCAQLRPDELFGTSPPPLRQGVLLSLVQQLGCDLSRDPSSRAAWIREAVLSMDPSDPLLAPHIQSILSNVYLLLEREVATRDGHVKADLRLCMRVISSLVRE